MQRFHTVAYKIATLVTQNYSTSFYSASRLFPKEMRDAIFGIYGFVRFADEIVDTFHEHNKPFLLDKFEHDFYEAMEQGISMNPILHAFQLTVKKYQIPDKHIQAFLKSMRDDLHKKNYQTQAEIDEYVYGSADVIGLMCLKVFCNGDQELYNDLEKPAMKLGSAFQKVNFLRDLQNDIEYLDRRYFPCLVDQEFNETTKNQIINEIEADFQEAYQGMKKLPKTCKLPVYIAYSYYSTLLNKIKRIPSKEIINKRIRIPNTIKFFIITKVFIYSKLNII